MSHIIVRVVMLAALFSPVSALAQSPSLPGAGLTPESAFYFFDRFGEALREFLTFNPENKARLQVSFAGERLAEIKVVLEEKGTDAPGLAVAQSRLEAHFAEAIAILEREKTKGKDVDKLARELDDDFEDQKDALKETFKAEERVLKEKERTLKREIDAAMAAGNTARTETLRAELAAVKAERERLETERESQEEALEAQKEKVEREMDDKAEAEDAIREAEEEKAEALAEATEEKKTLPTDFFVKFDRLLAQAKELFGRGNYQGAEQLAEQAEDALDEMEETLGDEENDNEDKNEEDNDKSDSGRRDGDDREEEGRDQDRR